MFTDDRTAEQRTTHPLAVIGTDAFMSGWGGAQGGASYAGWACTPDQVKDCTAYVEHRAEMQRVRLVVLDGYRPRAMHTHIYIFNPEIHTVQ